MICNNRKKILFSDYQKECEVKLSKVKLFKVHSSILQKFYFSEVGTNGSLG